MKRSNEFLVGLSAVAALILVVVAALWLSQTSIGKKDRIYTARFQTVGGLNVGAPVTLRGVGVGRVEAIRLTDDGWVEADLKVHAAVELPARPAVVAASSSLFGEWAAEIISADQSQEDPTVRYMLLEASRPGGPEWPGATLPDVGQLTAQASRIAGDIAALADRVEGTFDSSAVADLRGTLNDFSRVAEELRTFVHRQSGNMEQVTQQVAATTKSVQGASRSLDRTLARVDSATEEGQLTEIMNSTRDVAANMQQTAADLRALAATLRAHDVSVVRVLAAADSAFSRIQAGTGTLGMLSADSALYQQTTLAVVELRKLIADIQANPRKYFKFSVF